MSARRFLAAAAAALIGAPVLMLATVAPAEAFSGSATLGCRIYFDTGVGSSPSVYADTFTLTTSPANPDEGDTVTVTATGAQGPTNGPVPLPADSLEVNVKVSRNGGNVINLNDPTYPNGPVAAQAKLGPWSATGTFTANNAGDIDLVVEQIQFDYKAGQIDTWCSAAGDRNHWANPQPTTIAETITVGGGGPDPTPTSSSPSPSPSGSSPSPSPSGSSPSPSPSGSSPSPSPSGSSPSPSPTQSGGSTDIATGSATATMTCELPPAFASSSDWKADLTVNVTGKDIALAWAQGPKTGPVPILGGTQKAEATLKAAGATVKLTAPAWPNDQAPYTNGPGQTVTGKVASIPASVSVDQIFFDDTSASNVDVTCTPKQALVIELETVSLPSEPPTPDGPLTLTGTPKAGGSITVAGEGFGSDTDVTVVMYSTPTVLGQTQASAAGALSVDVTIPTGTSGEHTMVAFGENEAGEDFVLSSTFTVTGSTGGTGGTTGDGGGTLADTGSRETLMTALVAAVLLQIGLIVAVRSYRAMPSRQSAAGIAPARRGGSHRSA